MYVQSAAGIVGPVKCRVLEIEWRTTDNTQSIDIDFFPENGWRHSDYIVLSIVPHSTHTKMPTTRNQNAESELVARQMKWNERKIKWHERIHHLREWFDYTHYRQIMYYWLRRLGICRNDTQSLTHTHAHTHAIVPQVYRRYIRDEVRLLGWRRMVGPSI